MFFATALELKTAQDRAQYLAEQVDLLNAQIKQMREDAESAKERDMQTSTFAIDFNATKVFAIERNMHNGDICTIVGCMRLDRTTTIDGAIHEKQDTLEWYLYCSQEQHEKLVKEFEAHKKGTK